MHIGQCARRLAVVKADIDAAFKLDKVHELLAFADTVMRAPESRLLAGALLHAHHDAAEQDRGTRPAINFEWLGASLLNPRRDGIAARPTKSSCQQFALSNSMAERHHNMAITAAEHRGHPLSATTTRSSACFEICGRATPARPVLRLLQQGNSQDLVLLMPNTHAAAGCCC